MLNKIGRAVNSSIEKARKNMKLTNQIKGFSTILKAEKTM